SCHLRGVAGGRSWHRGRARGRPARARGRPAHRWATRSRSARRTRPPGPGRRGRPTLRRCTPRGPVGPAGARPCRFRAPSITTRRIITHKEALRTDRAPQPAGQYSHSIESSAELITAGFGSQDPATGEVADSDAEQTRQVLRNLQALLAERGATLYDALKATVHLADLAYAPAFNEAYREFFTEPFPVRTTVGSELANILV